MCIRDSAGTIAKIVGEVGEYSTPSPPGVPTPPAIDLIDDSCLYVKAPMDEVDAPKISAGQSVRISLDALPRPVSYTHLILLIVIVALPTLIGIWLVQRFGGDVAVDYDSPTEHFKYGSTGGEHEMGFPYWIWRALPDVCPQYLPGKGYQSLGMVYEKNSDGSDKDVPVGTSRRRYQGIDRVFVNCAVCHTSTCLLYTSRCV